MCYNTYKVPHEVASINHLKASIVHSPTITDGMKLIHVCCHNVFLYNYIFRKTKKVDMTPEKVDSTLGADIASDASSLYSETASHKDLL